MHIQGPKGIPTSLHTKRTSEIPFLNTLRIRTFSYPLLPQPDHIPSGLAPILALNSSVLYGRVHNPVPVPSHYRVIKEHDCFSLFLPVLIRIGTCRRLTVQGTRSLIWIWQNRRRVQYHKVATPVVIIESLQTLNRHVHYTKDVWSADGQRG